MNPGVASGRLWLEQPLLNGPQSKVLELTLAIKGRNVLAPLVPALLWSGLVENGLGWGQKVKAKGVFRDRERKPFWGGDG